MKHIESRRNFRKEKDEVSDFAKFGEKECEGRCDRVVVMTKKGPIVACNACKRIVMDNRNLSVE